MFGCAELRFGRARRKKVRTLAQVWSSGISNQFVSNFHPTRARRPMSTVDRSDGLWVLKPSKGYSCLCLGYTGRLMRRGYQGSRPRKHCSARLQAASWNHWVDIADSCRRTDLRDFVPPLTARWFDPDHTHAERSTESIGRALASLVGMPGLRSLFQVIDGLAEIAHITRLSDQVIGKQR